MKKNFAIVILIYILLFIALASMKGEILALAIPIALYLLSGLWFAPDAIKLNITREMDAERITPNQPVKITLRVTNIGKSHLEEVFLKDQISPALEILSGYSSYLCTLKKGESVSWSYTLTGPRGSFLFKGIKATASDHLNITQKTNFTLERIKNFYGKF